MEMKDAIITIESGAVSLMCEKGTAKLTIKPSNRSVLGNYRDINSAIGDLVSLAAPQSVKLLLSASTADELCESERIAVNTLCTDYRINSAVLMQSNGNEVPITMPKLTEITPFKKPIFSLRAQHAQLLIDKGSVLLIWKERSSSQCINEHAQLLIPDYTSVSNAIQRAKKELDMPDNVVVHVIDPSTLCQMEHYILVSALHTNELIAEVQLHDKKFNLWTFDFSNLNIIIPIVLCGYILSWDGHTVGRLVIAAMILPVVISVLRGLWEVISHKRMVNNLLLPHKT